MSPKSKSKTKRSKSKRSKLKRGKAKKWKNWKRNKDVKGKVEESVVRKETARVPLPCQCVHLKPDGSTPEPDDEENQARCGTGRRDSAEQERTSKKKKPRSRSPVDNETISARKRHISEMEWFKKQCDLFIKPPTSEKDKTVREVVAGLKKKMAMRWTIERWAYEGEPYTEAFARLEWRNAPRVVKCCCPHMPCICRRTIPLLPAKRLPIACAHRFIMLRKIWRWIREHILNFDVEEEENVVKVKTSKHTVVPNLEKKLRIDFLVYKKLNERDLMESTGPEFCLDDCIPFFRCEKNHCDRRRCECEINYKALVQELREEAQRELELGTAEITPIRIDQGPVGFRQKKKREERDRVCDSYIYGGRCSVKCQTQYNRRGQLAPRGYLYFRFASIDPMNLCTVDGARFQLKAYVKPKPPRSTSNLLKLYNVIKPPVAKRCSKLKSDTLKRIFNVPLNKEKFATISQQVEANEILEKNGLQLCEEQPNTLVNISDTSITGTKKRKLIEQLDALPKVEPKPAPPPIDESAQKIMEPIDNNAIDPVLLNASTEEPARAIPVEPTPEIATVVAKTMENKSIEELAFKSDSGPICCCTIDSKARTEKPWCCPTCSCTTIQKTKEESTVEPKQLFNITAPKTQDKTDSCTKKPWCCPTCSCTTIENAKKEPATTVKTDPSACHVKSNTKSCPSESVGKTIFNTEPCSNLCLGEAKTESKTAHDCSIQSKRRSGQRSNSCHPRALKSSIDLKHDSLLQDNKCDLKSSASICCETDSNEEKTCTLARDTSLSMKYDRIGKTALQEKQSQSLLENVCLDECVDDDKGLAHNNSCDVDDLANDNVTIDQNELVEGKDTCGTCETEQNCSTINPDPSTICHIKSTSQPFIQPCTQPHTSKKYDAINDYREVPSPHASDSKEDEPKIRIESLISKLILNRQNPPSERIGEQGGEHKVDNKQKESGNDSDNCRNKDAIHVGRSSVELPGETTLKEIIHRSSSSTHSLKMEPRLNDKEQHSMRVEIKQHLIKNSKESKKSMIKSIFSLSYFSKSSKNNRMDADLEAKANLEPVQTLSSKKKQIRDPMSRRAGCHILKRVLRK